MVRRVVPRESLEPIERASVDELRAVQLERLRKSLQHSYDNVAPFRNKCKAQEVVPADLVTLSDLSRFPFMYKDDLRAAYPFGLFAVPEEQVVRVHASSGTTGKPTVVGYTRNDIETWAKVCARSFRAGGVEASDRIHKHLDYNLL